jgi:hypothetical protein
VLAAIPSMADRETQMYFSFEHIIDISHPTFKAADGANRNR